MTKAQPQKELTEEQKLKAQQKEERRLAFEAKRAAELANKKPPQASQTKSNAELRKERREKQEAQRAAKQQQPQKTGKEQQKDNPVDAVDFKIQSDVKDSLNSLKHQISLKDQQSIHQAKAVKQPNKQQIVNSKSIDKQSEDKSNDKSSKSQSIKSTKSSSLSSGRKDQIFVHIPKRETDLNELTKGLGYNSEHIHSSFIKIGLKMNQNLITDPSNRCIAFLVALKSFIQDYVQLPSKQISRDLGQILDKNVEFLDRCRPLSVNMCNVIRIMRNYITKLNSELNLEEAKNYLVNLIDKFMYEEIECGLNGIREHGNSKINQNDVILTFGNSFLIQHIFKEAKKSGKQFRVIVVDSYPRLDGKKLIEFLNKLEINATYVLISALSYVMKEANKVLIEAHTLLANGYMISDMGSSQIALVAKANNVPVLICCETYKFSERVHTDSFVFNEADSAKDFLTQHNKNSDLCKLFSTITTDDQHLNDKNLASNLNILNLYYDVTPREFISLVITEMGFLPCTSALVIIRRNILKFQLDGQ